MVCRILDNLFAIFVWGTTDALFEKTCEMLWILEAQFIRNFAYCFAVVINSFFCYIHKLKLDMLFCRFACLFFNKVSEIVRRQMELVGTILHRRQPRKFWFVGVEIVIKGICEFCEDIFVDEVSCYELSVIETCTVIKKQLYVAYDESLRMFVNRMLQFILYVAKAFLNYFALLF